MAIKVATWTILVGLFNIQLISAAVKLFLADDHRYPLPLPLELPFYPSVDRVSYVINIVLQLWAVEHIFCYGMILVSSFLIFYIHMVADFNAIISTVEEFESISKQTDFNYWLKLIAVPISRIKR